MGLPGSSWTLEPLLKERFQILVGKERGTERRTIKAAATHLPLSCPKRLSPSRQASVIGLGKGLSGLVRARRSGVWLAWHSKFDCTMSVSVWVLYPVRWPIETARRSWRRQARSGLWVAD